MKKRLLALGLIGCMRGVSAQPPQAPQQEPQSWATKMFGPATNLVHDFGTVPRGAKLHHDFVMTNIYAVPIEITNIRVPMGCWGATTNKQELQPSEKATIGVWMDGSRFTGQKEGAIWVTVGPTYISTAKLTVKAFSRHDIVCEPGEVAFGSVESGQIPSATVAIEYTGPLALQISEAIVPRGAPFDAKLQEIDRRPGQVSYQVTVSLKKDAAPGKFEESILLKTNDPTARLLPVLVRGNIQSKK
jgi:hypothetical protein